MKQQRLPREADNEDYSEDDNNDCNATWCRNDSDKHCGELYSMHHKTRHHSPFIYFIYLFNSNYV